MDIAVVAVISTAAVAIVGHVATVLMRRVDRKHELKLQQQQREETSELRIADWQMGLIELRRDAYLPLVMEAIERLGRLTSGAADELSDGSRAERRAKLALYGSSSFQAAWHRFEAAIEQRDQSGAEAALVELREAANAEAKPIEPGLRTTGLQQGGPPTRTSDGS